MTIRANKEKGRRLQQWVCNQLLLLLPGVKPDDVVSRPMGSNGEDVMLSPYARKLFPYSVECKNQEKINLWSAWSQTTNNSNEHEPLLIVGKNRHRPLAVIDAEHFLQLTGWKRKD